LTKVAKRRNKKSPIISIIVSVDENRGIGYKSKLPWDIPKDRRWFKEKTLRHVVVMGSNTYRSIIKYLGKPLPGRINVVLSRKDIALPDDVYLANSLEDALKKAKKLEKNGEIFIIGGGSVYLPALAFADRLYITEVKGKYKADTFFPDYSDFNKVVDEKRGSDGNYNYTFKILEKG